MWDASALRNQGHSGYVTVRSDLASLSAVRPDWHSDVSLRREEGWLECTRLDNQRKKKVQSKEWERCARGATVSSYIPVLDERKGGR